MTDYGHDLRLGAFLSPQSRRPQDVVALAQLSERSGLDLATFRHNLGELDRFVAFYRAEIFRTAVIPLVALGVALVVLVRRAIRLNTVISVNIVLGENVVPEFHQRDVRSERLTPPRRDVLGDRFGNDGVHAEMWIAQGVYVTGGTRHIRRHVHQTNSLRRLHPARFADVELGVARVL